MMLQTMSANHSAFPPRLFLALLALFAFLAVPAARAADDGNAANGVSVLEAFSRQQEQRANQASELTDHGKRVIMFALAVPLFLLLLITAGLGIATGVYGKRLFIPHMVCAGLTMTLAIAHVIAGVVWFYPF